MAIGVTGTGGGGGGMNGAQRRIALALGAAYLAIFVIVITANVFSMRSDFASAGVAVSWRHLWTWEASSLIGWLSVLPAIWWLMAYVRPPRFRWPVAVALMLAASIPASLWHIGVMVALRKAAYALWHEEYRFFGAVAWPVLYEFRKDLATFARAIAFAGAAQWLIARAGETAPERIAEPTTLAVTDGAITHHLPIDEIDHVAAAGNYVEIAWGPRTLLHRATLSAVEGALGTGFVRIHRGRLVRRAAIRSVGNERSGDFTILLASGVTVRGSRRYRDLL